MFSPTQENIPGTVAQALRIIAHQRLPWFTTKHQCFSFLCPWSYGSPDRASMVHQSFQEHKAVGAASHTDDGSAGGQRLAHRLLAIWENIRIGFKGGKNRSNNLMIACPKKKHARVVELLGIVYCCRLQLLLQINTSKIGPFFPPICHSQIIHLILISYS